MSGTRNMLIVEDDPDDLHLLQRAFRKANIDVNFQIAVDGDEAIDALGRAAEGDMPSPRVVLLDLKLPRRSGFEVLEWVKAQPGLRRVPIVILTSSDQNSDLAKAYDLGANSYLVKPAAPAALTAMVQQIDTYWLGLNKVA